MDHPRAVTTLRLGERTLVQSDEGLLAAEYALFDGADIVLRATDPVSVREAGYMTTARDALDRLARAGVTPGLAEAAARSIAPEVSASFARGAAARSVVGRLGAQELFDGAIYRMRFSHYEGAWLDLAALSPRLGVPGSPVFLQVLHLTAALSEVAPATPVHLSTASATRDRRPGERTHTRVDLEGALRIPDALSRLSPRTELPEADPAHDRRMRRALVARVRERMNVDANDRLRSHLNALDGALAPRTMELGPLSDPDLQTIERRLATGDASGIDEQLDQLERQRGPGAGIRYLRARAALLRGEQAPRSVAQFLSDIAENGEDFHQAALRAARSWLAAGDETNARYFAQRLVEDATAPDGERLVALEILEEAKSRSIAPPSPERPNASWQAAGNPPLASSGGYSSFPPPPLPVAPLRFDSRSASQPPPATRPTQRPQAPSSMNPTGPAPGPREADTGHPPGAAAGPSARPKGPVRRYEPEIAESLALPSGGSESALGPNERPRNALQARVAMTRLARELGRDYRLWYGKTLRSNVLAVDAMQQHLMQRFVGAPIADEVVAWELLRHGALLSEIIARALGGAWVDVAPSEPGYWAMHVPSGTRSWPIGRVLRFVALGHREKDLVGYYLDLEARVRSAGG